MTNMLCTTLQTPRESLIFAEHAAEQHYHASHVCSVETCGQAETTEEMERALLAADAREQDAMSW